ncbi:PREDICTED: exocyst complex component EXO70A1-like [Tarenaya hassleriana]|uniref:exocyst complex component EXO70A1-like n=1 Tax=Tarenaya hassleriana TaxID=28532 RepID=UPI00053C0DE2|nr:PREDICTED: exocyst complex component EXO70A1-like [Tarenaya hassleriana]
MRSLSLFYKGSSKKASLSLSAPGRRIVSPLIDATIESAAEIIEKWSTEYSTSSNFYSLFNESKREAREFVRRVKDLQKAMDLLILEDANAEQSQRAQNLMKIAMKRLRKEFYQILSMNRAHLDPEPVSSRSSDEFGTSDHSSDEDGGGARHRASDSITEMEEVSINAMADLKSIADCMLAAGYAKECGSMYKTLRKSIIDEAMYRLGIEKISPSTAKKMSWEVVELKTQTWLEALKVSMTTLFNGERVLCDHIFLSSDAIRESCFSNISNDGALLLFGFPEMVAAKDKKNPPPEKIFRLLEMYRGIDENSHAIRSIFSLSSSSAVISRASNSLNQLSEMIRSLMADFENGIQKDTSKTVVRAGGVHPLTVLAMNYLSLLADHCDVLADILMRSPPLEKSLLPESYFNVSESDGSPASEIRIRFAWLILVLLCKIDAKSESYKDFSVQYLFLANNLQHVVSCVHGSWSMRNLLGDDWIARHFDKARQFAASYERLAWGSVASALTKNPSSPESVMECFETFAASFESAYKKESACVVPDPNLRDEMKMSIARKLVPIYREFYYTHRNTVVMAGNEAGMKLALVVRFTPDDVENYLSGLFFGKGILENTHPTLSSISVSYASSTSPNRRSRSCRRF